VETLGFKEVEFTKPIGYCDLSFLDYCVYSGEEAEKLDHDIHKILFSSIEPKYDDFCKKRGIDSKTCNHKWINAKVDVLVLWCHIYYNKDILVTHDENFKRCKPDLAQILSKKIEIMNPEEFVANFSKL